MLNQCITILAMAVVTGPDGRKLKPGQTYEYDDSTRLRILVKSGNVSLIDPASFDEGYLEKAGYELKEGYSYPEKKPTTPENVPKRPDEDKVPEKDVTEEISHEPITEEEGSKKGASDHEPSNLQLTRPVGMGVKKSVDSN